MGSSCLLECLQGYQTGRLISYVFPIQAMDTGELYHSLKKEKTILAAKVSEQSLEMQNR